MNAKTGHIVNLMLNCRIFGVNGFKCTSKTAERGRTGTTILSQTRLLKKQKKNNVECRKIVISYGIIKVIPIDGTGELNKTRSKSRD